jgi:hypothetical protein
LQDAFLQEYDPGILAWDNGLQDRLWWGTGFYRIDAEETGLDFGDGEYAWTSRACFLLWDNPDHRYLMHVGASYSLRASEFDPTTVAFIAVQTLAIAVLVAALVLAAAAVKSASGAGTATRLSRSGRSVRRHAPA